MRVFPSPPSERNSAGGGSHAGAASRLGVPAVGEEGARRSRPRGTIMAWRALRGSGGGVPWVCWAAIPMPPEMSWAMMSPFQTNHQHDPELTPD